MNQKSFKLVKQYVHDLYKLFVNYLCLHRSTIHSRTTIKKQTKKLPFLSKLNHTLEIRSKLMVYL